jgi:iron(III) transport system permease protein
MGRLLTGKRITLWAAVAVLVVAGVLPLCLMLSASLAGAGNYTGTLGNHRIWGLFRSSLLLTILTTAFAGLAGVTLGVLFAKTDLPLRTVLLVVLSLPLLFPPYILAVGWYQVLGRGGLLAQVCGSAA